MTSYADVYRSVHTKMEKKDLIPMIEVDEVMNEQSMKDLVAFSEKTGTDIEDVYYYSTNSYFRIFYYKFPYYYTFHTLGAIEQESFKYDPAEEFLRVKDTIDRLLAEKNYDMYFHVVEGLCDFMILKELFHEFEGHEKYDRLLYMYFSTDYGYHMLVPEMWREAMEQRTSDSKDMIPGTNEEVTIYRGQESLSTPVDKAMSWTTNINTAIMFASRYTSQNSKLYKASIKREDIIDYIDERNESEILVFPEDVYNIQEVKQYDLEEVFSNLKDSKVMQEYLYYKSTYIEDGMLDYSDLPELHGEKHTKRVLLHSLILSEYENLNHVDRAILAVTAIFHDLGRLDDGIDISHGERSFDLLQDEIEYVTGIQCKNIWKDYRLLRFNREEKEIISFIVKNHNLADDKAFENLPNTIKDSKRAKKLFLIFKDADALDRVRLNDLDVSQLRSDYAKKMVIVAKKVLQHLK